MDKSGSSMTFSSITHYLMIVKADRIEVSSEEEALFLTKMKNFEAQGGSWERTFSGSHLIPSSHFISKTHQR